MNITTPPPDLVKQEAVIADRIASIAVPSTGTSIWDAFKQESVGQPIGFRSTGGFQSTLSEAPLTTSLKGLQSSLVADSSRYTKYLPQLGGPASKGVATARQHSLCDHANGTCYAEDTSWQYAVEGGRGAAGVKGNTQFVDDKGWGVTLKQILGSRMLSPEMLKKASIQNVQKIVQVQGGTPQQTQELQFMFQRMMLEGFIRGVDITKEMVKQGGLKISIDKTISGKTSVIGVAKSGPGRDTVQFGANWWNNHADADKYTLFLHEVGHSLLNASHENNSAQKKKDNSIMTPIYNGSVLKNYNGMVNELFLRDNTASVTKIGVKDFGGPAAYDQAWFPSLSEKPTEGYDAGAGTPSGTEVGSKPGDNISNTTNTTINNTYVPPSITPGTTSNTIGGAGMRFGTPQQAGVMAQPTMARQPSTLAFAAGMADLSKANPSPISEAGALLRAG